jgi:hypothetical protein
MVDLILRKLNLEIFYDTYMKLKPFHKQYPYLAYWIEDWGEMQTSGGGHHPYLCLVDEGGNVYTDWETSDRTEALKKAEKYLREVDFPSRMDKETIESLEEDYKTCNLIKS